jgi:hypothetical protein
LIGRSPHGNEQSKLGLKSTMSKLPPKPATKVERAKEMSYFMETLDLKNQIQQLELQNRQLRIEFKKARQAYLELQFKDRTRDTQDDEPEEIQEREFFAEVVLVKIASRQSAAPNR